jgi:hypothetical protein
MPYNGLYSSFLNLQRTTQLRGGCVFCLLDAGPWGGSNSPSCVGVFHS